LSSPQHALLSQAQALAMSQSGQQTLLLLPAAALHNRH
jgi:hypothetical protein